MLNPLEGGDGVDNGHADEAGDKEENVEALKQKVKELEDTLIEHWECNTQHKE